MLDNHNASPSFAVGSGGDASIFGVNQLPDILGIVKSKLQQSAADSELFAKVFGDKANTAELQAVRSQWAIGDFSQLPSVQILSSESANGVLGAYSSSTQTVYLSDELLQATAAPNNSLFGAAGVLVEETFHWLDDRVGVDTQGDEGELARNLLFGSDLSPTELARIKSEDDRGFITVGNSSILVEQATVAPDLAIVGPSAPSAIAFGSTFNIGVGTKNIGTGVAGASTTKFWLSSNTTLDTSDILLGSQSINGLNAGVAQTGTFSFVYNNSAWGTGTKYILFQADADKKVSESNESNNVGSVVVSLNAPDLSVVGQTTPITVTAFGSNVTFNSATKNNGNGVAAASATKYWLSNDAIWDASDIGLGSQSINSLNGGASQSTNFTFAYNSSWGTGPKYILSQADADKKVTEINESNNFAATAIAVKVADLAITGQTAPSAIAFGSKFNIGVGTKNIGTGVAVASTTKFWLSNNTTLDSSDIALGSQTINGLNAGAAQTGTFSFVYNNSAWGTGTKYILFQADADKKVSESNESNNIASVAVSLNAPDLTVVGQTSPIAVNAFGSNVTFNSVTKNNGNGVAAASTTKYWLSNDAVWDASDIALGSQSINSLNGGASQSTNFTFAYNSSWGTGAKYILSQADADKKVTEINESNNFASTAIAVNIADLVITGQTAPSTITFGSSVTIGVGTKNIGNGVAAASTTKYWLSNDASLDATDTFLGSQAINSLLAGAAQTSSFSFAYNSSWGTGAKYIFFQADADNKVSETNNSNNLAYVLTSVIIKTGDWFDQNIQDAELRTIARSKYTDGKLDRNEMISIFKDAEDGSTISGTELLDLRTLITNSSYLGIADYVKVLSNKLVNGDVANTKSGIGNLSANSTASQMTSLIGKWFLGSDRPDTSYTYQYASGSLFQNGVSYQDINQGSVGNCYFLAGLAATAFRTPSTIQNMFIDNGDNTYTVRFYNNGVADYVTVDRYLPTTSWGTFIYAHQSASNWGKYNDATNELWVALAEKAYAQLNESGWIGQDNTNSYEGISGGWEGAAIKHITGLTASYKSLNFDSMVTAFTNGKFMTVGSKDSGVAANVAANHAYTVVGYNSTTQKFKLFNPWGVNNGSSKSGILELSWSELTASFSGWTHTV
jgi:subtilase family serine protease